PGAADGPRTPAAPAGPAVPVTMAEAVAGVAAALGRHAPGAVAMLASPRMANEDLMALRRLAERLGIRRVGFRVPPRVPGDEDDLLLRADRNPNTRGAELIGLDRDVRAILEAARRGEVRCLWVFGHDLLDGAWPEAETRAALGALDTLIWSGTNANRTSALAHWALPAAAWVERDGTFTNFEGRVQRFRTAVEPLGEALADWETIGRVLGALGASPRATRAEHWFRELAGAVPAFAGLTYASIGDTGAMIDGRAPAS
ncbi:MAG: molybdopterin-dependent oxidoreductase, partial [Candidatus Rokuibacteriota bacterium]